MSSNINSRSASNTYEPQVNNGSNPSPRYLTRAETCDLLRVTLPTLRDWSNKGYLRKYKIGGAVRYRHDELIQAIENRGE